jgi:predicted TIM-barrel fold metal-dependent hydrolase
LSTGAFKAVKIYTGYSDRYPTDPEYTKVFGICTNAKVPVIFHTGDTWWPEGPIETSHPFVFDGVAKNNPDTVFVLAHSGNPFFKEAAVVAYRNKNVYLDLACAIVEENPRKEDYLKNVAEGLTQGINYAGIGKFMHASDWPLVSMAEALKLTRAVIKAPEWELVIKETAKKVFRI